MEIASWILWSFAAIGLVSLLIQRLTIARHQRPAVVADSAHRPISVLKPLCGVDDGLADTLEQFARLQYPAWELLLAWLNGFFERKVNWRGRWLEVRAGSRLVRPQRPFFDVSIW